MEDEITIDEELSEVKPRAENKSKLNIGKFIILFISVISSLYIVEIFFKELTLSIERKEATKCLSFAADYFSNSQIFSLVNAYYKPLDSVDHCNPEWRYTYHIDERGLRSSQKDITDSTLLAIGDSFTFGFGVKDNESFPALLNAYNAGMWGNPFNVQLASFKRNIDLVKPKTVIWGIYPSHVVTMMPGNWSQYCPGDKTIFTGSSIKDKLMRKFFEKIVSPLSVKSYAFTYILKNKNILSIQTSIQEVKININCYATKEVLLYDKNIANNAYTSDANVNRTFLIDRDNVYKNIRNYFEEAKIVATEKDVEVYFLIIPSRLNMKIKDGSYKSPYKGSDIDPDLPLNTFRTLITDAGFKEENIIDLSKYFIETGNWQEYYYKIDAHWNSKGHEFVAKLLKERLKL